MQIDVSFLPALAAAFLLTLRAHRHHGHAAAGPRRDDRAVARAADHRAGAHGVCCRCTSRPITSTSRRSGRSSSMLVQEIVIGAVLGLTARLAISALQIAGSVVAQQLGLGFVTAVDPTQGQQGVMVGNFLTRARHHADLRDRPASSRHRGAQRQLHVSSSRARCRSPATSPSTSRSIVATAFRIGIQLSAPFLVFGLLFNLGLGVLSRLMPQMQVFFIGLPLSILLGLLAPAAGDRRDDGHLRRLHAKACSANWRRSSVSAWPKNKTIPRRTEDPTQKRLDEALKRGDVVKSQEVNTWFVIAGATLVLIAFSGGDGQRPDRDHARADRQFLPHPRRRPALLGLFQQDRPRDCWRRWRCRSCC